MKQDQPSPPEQVTGALVLAAGGSRRFGAADKLLAELDGQPLVLHSLRRILRDDLAVRVAVTASGRVGDLARGLGIETCEIAPGQQSDSLRAGIARLQARGVTRGLVLLGDMPFLSGADLSQLLATPADRAASAVLEGVPMPPAIFPARLFGALLALGGDRGAGALLRDLPGLIRIGLPPAHLRDIDRPEDL